MAASAVPAYACPHPLGYEVWLLDPATGEPLDVIDQFDRLEYDLRVNDYGEVSLVLAPDWDYTLARLDARIVIWRRPEGGRRYLEAAYFMRMPERNYTGRRYNIVLGGPGYNEILTRRVVAYNAGTGGAEKSTQAADDAMKAYVSENLGASAIDADRDITGLGFSTQENLLQGPLITKDAAWQPLIQTLQELAQASRDAGTPVYFGTVPLGRGYDMQFQTKANYWGNDHTQDGTHGLVTFALERGNMINPVLMTDYHNEFTVAYAKGQGTGDSTEMVEVEDATRSAASPLNRRETTADSQESTNDDALTAAGESALDAARPQRTFTFQPQDTESCKYGLHWWFGDLVAASFWGEEAEFHVVGIHVVVEGGRETVEATAEEYPIQ